MLAKHYINSREIVIANVCKSISEVSNLEEREIKNLFVVGFRNYALNQKPHLLNKVKLVSLRILWDLVLKFPKMQRLLNFYQSQFSKKKELSDSPFKPDFSVKSDGSIQFESELFGIEEGFITSYNPLKSFSNNFFAENKIL
jgi:hypothetical protein